MSTLPKKGRSWKAWLALFVWLAVTFGPCFTDMPAAFKFYFFFVCGLGGGYLMSLAPK